MLVVGRIPNDILDIFFGECKCQKIKVFYNDNNYHLYIKSIGSESFFNPYFSLYAILLMLSIRSFNFSFFNTTML